MRSRGREDMRPDMRRSCGCDILSKFPITPNNRKVSLSGTETTRLPPHPECTSRTFLHTALESRLKVSKYFYGFNGSGLDTRTGGLMRIMAAITLGKLCYHFPQGNGESDGVIQLRATYVDVYFGKGNRGVK